MLRLVLKGEKRTVRFPMTPSQIDVNGQSRTLTLDTLEQPIELPNGRGQKQYSWSGRLPGPMRQSASYVFSDVWEPPEVIDDELRDWLDSGDKRWFIITDTHIADHVFISSYQSSRIGDDIKYTITLTEWRDTFIGHHGDKKPKRHKKDHHDKDKPDHYTVRAGDTLHSIAHIFLGSANKWREIKKANPKLKENDPDDKLKPGTVLRIPGL